ncbi:MAG: TIGR03905 family TSCPD domain-containing protein [Lachnospiraceae bacterium]|nr:TIGR03905 family TSCPD domain-containing protein [Lachnospiraceae bacterium]MCR5087188.1 TIGR03905 family TSCPD domain-containing protein [Lachnospiraceae bacterium]
MVYRTSGTCSSQISYDVVNENGTDVVRNVVYTGGCNGNLQGIGRLVEGLPVDEVIARLQGIRCGYKSTSCPDQLAKALLAYKAEQ